MKRQFCQADMEHMWQWQTGTKVWQCLFCPATSNAKRPCVLCGAERAIDNQLWCQNCHDELEEETWPRHD